jgi:acetoin utilization protein AcuB
VKESAAPSDTPITMDGIGDPHALEYATTVASVMSTRVLTIEPNATLLAARDMLHREHVHHLLVGDRGHVVAVLSDRDLLRAVSPFLGTIAEQPRDSHTLMRPVFQVATYHPQTVAPEATIYEAAALMLDEGISCLPVVDHFGRVVGVITTRDLVRGLLACAVPEDSDAASSAA